jgi:hypothetical protein
VGELQGVGTPANNKRCLKATGGGTGDMDRSARTGLDIAPNARSEVRLVVEAEVASENAGAQALFCCFHLKKCPNVSK